MLLINDYRPRLPSLIRARARLLFSRDQRRDKHSCKQPADTALTTKPAFNEHTGPAGGFVLSRHGGVRPDDAGAAKRFERTRHLLRIGDVRGRATSLYQRVYCFPLKGLITPNESEWHENDTQTVVSR